MRVGILYETYTRKKIVCFFMPSGGILGVSAKSRIVHPLELPPDLDAKVTHAAEKMGKTKAETMRIAMHIGLRRLELYQFDPYGAVATVDPVPHASALKVAENPMGNELRHSIPAASVTYRKTARRKKA
jgi:hypothetical protein